MNTLSQDQGESAVKHVYLNEREPKNSPEVLLKETVDDLLGGDVQQHSPMTNPGLILPGGYWKHHLTGWVGSGHHNHYGNKHVEFPSGNNLFSARRGIRRLINPETHINWSKQTGLTRIQLERLLLPNKVIFEGWENGIGHDDEELKRMLHDQLHLFREDILLAVKTGDFFDKMRKLRDKQRVVPQLA